jgi:hypothetical protein
VLLKPSETRDFESAAKAVGANIRFDAKIAKMNTRFDAKSAYET